MVAGFEELFPFVRILCGNLTWQTQISGVVLPIIVMSQTLMEDKGKSPTKTTFWYSQYLIPDMIYSILIAIESLNLLSLNPKEMLQ